MGFLLQLVLEYTQKPQGHCIPSPKSAQQSFTKDERQNCKPWGEQGKVWGLVPTGSCVGVLQMSSPGSGLEKMVHYPAQTLKAEQTRCPASLWAPEPTMLTATQNGDTQILSYLPSPICYKNQVAPARPNKNISILRMLMGFWKQRFAH